MDKTLKCRDCSADFAFTEGEQAFYASHGLMNEPTRCPSCRAMRKAQRGGGEMDAAPRRTREMFPAVCAECGTATQVPFMPRNDRPVYCSTCFDKVRAER
ncbi:MAG: zinc-ribbon domain containing protein [Chloroflexota bacterium]